MKIPLRSLTLGFLVVITVAAPTQPARAYYLDAEHRFDVRLRAYSQLGLLDPGFRDTDRLGRRTRPAFRARRLPHAATGTDRVHHAARIRRRRPRAAPELLQPRVRREPDRLHAWAGASEFKFRFAWWGFYDGLYDYLNPEWADRARSYKTRFSESNDPANESYKFDDHWKRARSEYAHQNRVNELYFDYTHGPFFIRVGKQAISWGESDTIAILDVSNPFDLTLGAPGFFQDVEEARIPLWTIRSTYKLIDVWGPSRASSATSTSCPARSTRRCRTNPITAGVSPFNPDQADPQFNILAQGRRQRTSTRCWSTGCPTRPGATPAGVHGSPACSSATTRSRAGSSAHSTSSRCRCSRTRRRSASSRRVAARSSTTAGQKCDPATAAGTCVKQAPAVTILDRRLESVIGLSSTWFSQPLNGILKWEIEYFIDELAVIPDKNLNARVQLPRALRANYEKDLKNSIPTADYVRWVVGYDRNFFVPSLNPTNSFILVMSYNSSFNLSEKGGNDYRNAFTKPGHTQTRNGKLRDNPLCADAATARTSPLCIFTDPHDYEDAYQYEGILTTTLRTDYMHATLQPSLTMITDISGVFGFAPAVSYRINDNLIVGATYLAVAATRKAGLGAFRAHDMLQLRVSAQFN
jgi:hypothetical protein